MFSGGFGGFNFGGFGGQHEDSMSEEKDVDTEKLYNVIGLPKTAN